MGEVYDEFERELLDGRRRYAHDPRREMVRLFLLALEREQIVSVGYRETLIAQRLSALSLPEEAREVMRHALLWAWKDEEIHAIYIRGVLLRMGGPLLKLQAFVQQLSGAVAGWAASVRQHLPWRQAPLSNALAAVLTLFGRLAGKVPRAVRTQLEYGPLRDFCLFQVDAERTAARCWERLAELAGAQPGDPALAGDFRRMKGDEDRHAQVFSVLGAALDEQDRLVPGETADTLAGKLAVAGEFFLPPERRRRAGSPVGRGGAVHVMRGTAPGEKRPLLRRLVQEAGLPASLRERAQALGRPVADLRVAVKPTFMIGYHRADPSPVTDPELVDELAGFLRDCGVAEVALIEAPTIYDRFYANRSVRQVADYLGFASPSYRVVDASEEQIPHEYARGMAQYSVSRTWKEADYRISFAKMRSNPVDAATLSVSNLEGLGPRHDQFFFAERQAHRDTATMMLLDEFPPHFALVDAYDRASDGLLGMMGNPRPKVPRRLYAATDPIALDMVALRHMGIADPDQSGMLEEARHWFGDPRPRTTVVGVDELIAGWRGPYSDEWSTLLSLIAYPVYQFGSGRGALFVPEMDEQAFPPREPPGLLLRAGRRAVQALFGLRLPR